VLKKKKKRKDNLMARGFTVLVGSYGRTANWLWNNMKMSAHQTVINPITCGKNGFIFTHFTSEP
jgi:hypothetical protein